MFSDTVAPQWALASVSCMFGNAVSAPSISNEISWTLQVEGNDEHSIQKLNIERIYTYPQVNSFEKKKTKFKTQIFNYCSFFFIQVKFKHLLYSGNAVLLKLSQALAFTDTLAIACLSAEPLNETDNCISAGWLINEGMLQVKPFHNFRLLRFLLHFLRFQTRELCQPWRN